MYHRRFVRLKKNYSKLWGGEKKCVTVYWKKAFKSSGKPKCSAISLKPWEEEGGKDILRKKTSKKRKLPTMTAKKSETTGVLKEVMMAKVPMLQAKLLSLLEKVRVSTQNRDQNKRKFSLKWQKAMGRTVGTWHTFTLPHNFKPGKKVFINGDYAKGTTKQFVELYHVARLLLLCIDPEYACNGDFVVQFALMTDPKKHYVKQHGDVEDITYQYAMGLGNYKGGLLRVHTKSGPRDIDIRNRLVKFDGRLPHEVVNYQGGNRFTVIFYKNYDRRILEAQPILQQPVIVYPVPIKKPGHQQSQSQELRRSKRLQTQRAHGTTSVDSCF
eukprot:g555.t1